MGRISTLPHSASGWLAAHSMASSRSFTSMMPTPAICSAVSANGPSVRRRLPSRTRAAIEEGTRALDEALALGAPGPYQIQAAIAALHVEAEDAASTDWPQIAALYERLYSDLPSPAIALNLAVARGMATRPEDGLSTLDRLQAGGALSGGTLVAAARADLLRRAGRSAEARAAYDEAIAGARSARQARFFERRKRACPG